MSSSPWMTRRAVTVFVESALPSRYVSAAPSYASAAATLWRRWKEAGSGVPLPKLTAGIWPARRLGGPAIQKPPTHECRHSIRRQEDYAGSPGEQPRRVA